MKKTYHDRNIATRDNWQPGYDVMVLVATANELEIIEEPVSPLYQLSWFMTFRKALE